MWISSHSWLLRSSKGWSRLVAVAGPAHYFLPQTAVCGRKYWRVQDIPLLLRPTPMEIKKIIHFSNVIKQNQTTSRPQTTPWNNYSMLNDHIIFYFVSITHKNKPWSHTTYHFVSSLHIFDRELRFARGPSCYLKQRRPAICYDRLGYVSTTAFFQTVGLLPMVTVKVSFPWVKWTLEHQDATLKLV